MSEYEFVVRDWYGYVADYCETREEADDAVSYFSKEFPDEAPFTVHVERRVHQFDPRGE